MAKVLREGVNVVLTHSETGEPKTFLAGQTVPKEYLRDNLEDHLWEGYTGAKADGPAAADAPAVPSNPDAAPPAPPAAEVPPLGGAGSGRDDWAAYAQGFGLEVSDDATRDEIVTLVDSAGYPTTRDS